ncbi:MAG TPA: dihydrofolate reductase family protein [Gemmatimonadaceae bacterium]|nr:dihydrofolate reductase family protein [Gemmatimonadaceae bacterium]
MREIVTFDRVSADGYFAAADGNLNWTVPDPELDREATAAMPSVDLMLFGRRTFDMFEGFWPSALGDDGTAEDPHLAGRRSPELRAMAEWLTRTEKLVFSRTRTRSDWANTRFAATIDREAIETLKRGPGGDIMIFGSGAVVTALTRLELVDEYRLVITPVLLGGGRSLLEGVPERPVTLAEARAFGTGNVLLRWRRRDA